MTITPDFMNDDLERDRDRDRSLDERAEGGDAFRLNLPPWLTTLGKSGAWALLAFWLVYSMMLQRDNQLSALSTNVVNNGTAILEVNKKIESAAQEMRRFADGSSLSDERIKLLLLEVCVQQAEMLKLPNGTQRCFDAANGLRSDTSSRR